MSEVNWTETARADLARVDDYYQDVAPDYAERLGGAALAASRFLADHPEAGPCLGAGLRKWRVRPHDFILIYRSTRAGIEVVRFHHARADWSRQ